MVLLLADENPPAAVAPFGAAQAAEFQQQWADYVGKELATTNTISMNMVLLPPGEFIMGRTEEELDRLLAVIDNDPNMMQNRGGMLTWSMLMMPAHRVRITKPFYMGACEVSVGQFRRFAEASGYETEAEQGLNHGKPYQGRRPMCTWRKPMAWRPNFRQDDNEPVLHLCWNDCVAFCKWLGEKEGREYCLPTESEWEYACRAGITTGRSGEAGKFRVAPLRELVWTAPYMHDGSLKTLEDVVDFYNRNGPEGKPTDLHGPLNLTDLEKKDLVEFLRSLSSERMTVALRH